MPSKASATEGVDETANWKTFTYEEFSFKYPQNWYIGNPQGIKNNEYVNFFLVGTSPIYSKSENQLGNEVFQISYSDGFISNRPTVGPQILLPTGIAVTRLTSGLYIIVTPLNKQVVFKSVPGKSDQYINQILSTFQFSN